MNAMVTTKDVRKGAFEAVSKGENQAVERELHQAGVLEAVACYCGQRAGHSRGRRACHCVLGKGCLQKYQCRRQRKGREKAVKRQGEDKLIEKVAFLTPKQGK